MVTSKLMQWINNNTRINSVFCVLTTINLHLPHPVLCDGVSFSLLVRVLPSNFSRVTECVSCQLGFLLLWEASGDPTSNGLNKPRMCWRNQTAPRGAGFGTLKWCAQASIPLSIGSALFWVLASFSRSPCKQGGHSSTLPGSNAAGKERKGCSSTIRTPSRAKESLGPASC